MDPSLLLTAPVAGGELVKETSKDAYMALKRR